MHNSLEMNEYRVRLRAKGGAASGAGAKAVASPLGLYKIFVHFEAVVHESIILSLPSTTCIAHTIAALSHGYRAINDCSPRPL